MEIKHFIACIDTLRILPKSPQRLLLHDASYSIVVPPEEGFPFTLEKICLFTRFYGATGSHRFILSVSWQNAEGATRTLWSQTTKPLEFNPALFVEDQVFAIQGILVPEPGLFEFRLTHAEEPEIIMATEYLEVR